MSRVRVVVHHQDRPASRRVCGVSTAQQAVAVDRLGQVVRGAQREAEVPVVQDGEHDDRDVGQSPGRS